MAGNGTKAVGIVVSGGVPGSVLNYLTQGSVYLTDWTLATGGKQLVEKAIYRLGNQRGKLTTAGKGQVVGVASSVREMRLLLSVEDTPDYALDADLASLRDAFERHINDDSMHGGGSGSFQFRTHTLVQGADTGTVTGWGLTYDPVGVMLTVSKPAGGHNIFATFVAGSLSRDGFSYTLSGLPDSGSYVLNYLLLA